MLAAGELAADPVKTVRRVSGLAERMMYGRWEHIIHMCVIRARAQIRTPEDTQRLFRTYLEVTYTTPTEKVERRQVFVIAE
eukprot:7937432-Pyramimonas_sp.AAC.1